MTGRPEKQAPSSKLTFSVDRSGAGPVLPHLRTLDGINTHDLAFKRTVSGGVTSSLILPGLANSIGGQVSPLLLPFRTP